MEREDIIKMLECIESHVFCEDTNRDYDYCMEGDCTECQIDFCKRQLEEGKVLDFKGVNSNEDLDSLPHEWKERIIKKFNEVN